MRFDPNNPASQKRYRHVAGLLLAVLLSGCGEPLVEAPTPFIAPDTPLSPTEAAPTEVPTEVAVQPTDPAAAPTEIPELDARPVEEPRLVPGQPVVIRQISMIDGVFGWAIGEHSDHAAAAPIHVLRTSDGGRTWLEVTPPEDPTLMTHIAGSHFAGDMAWIRYPGTDRLWRTVNGGATWSPVQAGYPMGFQTWFAFTGSQHGWMLQELESGFGSQLVALFSTSDGGDSWDEIIDPYATDQLQSCVKTGLSFAGTENGWVTYDCQGNYLEPFLDTSTDGGRNWLEGQLPVPSGAPPSTEEGWCYSSSPNLIGGSLGTLIITCVSPQAATQAETAYLYSTEDLGDSWGIEDYPGGEYHRLADGTLFALGREQFVSVDGGASWSLIKTVNWDGQYSVISPLTMWAVAVDADEVALVSTTDGGRTWQLLDPVVSSE